MVREYLGDALLAVRHDPALSIVHEVLPGQSCPVDIRPGETIRVMTGAEVPATANAVVPVEQAETQPDDKSCPEPFQKTITKTLSELKTSNKKTKQH